MRVSALPPVNQAQSALDSGAGVGACRGWGWRRVGRRRCESSADAAFAYRQRCTRHRVGCGGRWRDANGVAIPGRLRRGKARTLRRFAQVHAYERTEQRAEQHALKPQVLPMMPPINKPSQVMLASPRQCG